MKVKLTDQQQELYSSSISSRVNFKTKTFTAPSNLKELHINELRFYGMNYLSLKLEAKYPSTIELEYTQSGYLTCFVLEGKCEIVEGKNKYCVLDNHYTCQAIQQSVRLTFDSITRLLFINIDFARIQGLPVIKNETRNILPPMKSILSEIRQCTEDCPIQCIFIESKILSLLYIVFEEFQNVIQTKNILPLGLSDEDIQKLRIAKVYIVQNISKNYTLIELAHQVGLNDFKLKKGFKELFGSTVFTYRHSIRMEKAKNMLQSGFQVNEVSEEIGYKHPHHFSAAFKEYFDVLPSMIKTKSQNIRL